MNEGVKASVLMLTKKEVFFVYKRIVSLITILVIGMIGLFDNVSAEEVSPYLLYTDTYSSTLTISGTTATCKSKCTGYAGETTRITITQTLQKKNSSGEWYSVTGWVKTVNKYVGSATNYSYNLSSGKYRLKSVFTVYAGSKYETVTKYSSEKAV